MENTGSQVADDNVHMLRNGGLEGLAHDRNALRTGGNSGYQALGLAIAAGAARVVLVGYDMRYIGNRSHWHDGHGGDTAGEPIYAGWCRLFETMRPPVPVLNASPGSRLKCFERVALEDVL